MELEAFLASLEQSSPDPSWSPALCALWWDRKGDWDKAHHESQRGEETPGERVHAYLHRKEGDESNARYWYNRAGEPFFEGTLEEEWEMLVERNLEA